MAAYAELTLDQGTTFAATLDLTNDDGTAINVANNSFQSHIRKSYYSNTLIANLTISVVDAANGSIVLGLDSANTANIRAGRYLYDLKMTSNTGTVNRILEGIITVTPQVTK